MDISNINEQKYLLITFVMVLSQTIKLTIGNVKMLSNNRTKSHLKWWVATGFISFGSIYSLTAFLGNVEALENLGAAANVALTFTSGIIGSAVISCAGTLTTKLKDRLIFQKNLDINAKLIMTSQGLSHDPSYSTHYKLAKELQQINEHAIKCNLLIKDFLQNFAISSIDKLGFYVEQATILKNDYLKLNPNLKDTYYLDLKLHGYHYQFEPLEIIAKASFPKIAVNGRSTIQKSPATKEVDSPAQYRSIEDALTIIDIPYGVISASEEKPKKEKQLEGNNLCRAKV